jgi:hypothetical protein
MTAFFLQTPHLEVYKDVQACFEYQLSLLEKKVDQLLRKKRYADKLQVSLCLDRLSTLAFMIDIEDNCYRILFHSNCNLRMAWCLMVK